MWVRSVASRALQASHVTRASFLLQDWPFDDGTAPPNQLIDDWFNLLKSRFKEEPGCCVAVHCVAGLGR